MLKAFETREDGSRPKKRSKFINFCLLFSPILLLLVALPLAAVSSVWWLLPLGLIAALGAARGLIRT